MKDLCVDPGEDTGFATFDGGKLVEAGTEKMWAFADAVGDALLRGEPFATDTYEGTYFEEPGYLVQFFVGTERLIVEDFRIYPEKARDGSLDWDRVRTARLIGALYWIARQAGVPMLLQPAKIKERAVASGAESLYFRPLHENRHANDAIQHGVYRAALDRGAKPIAEDESGA